MKTEGQKVYEAGLLAIVDTARKAFFEGYNRASSLEQSDELLQWAWEHSKTYEACVKAVEMYTGKPFKAE